MSRENRCRHKSDKMRNFIIIYTEFSISRIGFVFKLYIEIDICLKGFQDATFLKSNYFLIELKCFTNIFQLHYFMVNLYSNKSLHFEFFKIPHLLHLGHQQCYRQVGLHHHRLRFHHKRRRSCCHCCFEYESWCHLHCC